MKLCRAQDARAAHIVLDKDGQAQLGEVVVKVEVTRLE